MAACASLVPETSRRARARRLAGLGEVGLDAQDVVGHTSLCRGGVLMPRHFRRERAGLKGMSRAQLPVFRVSAFR